MMINGGNMKLRDFFDKYYIPKDGPMNFKYRTKAGYYYRKQVKSNHLISHSINKLKAQSTL